MNNLELKSAPRGKIIVHQGRRPCGARWFRPTLRHQMILVAYAAVLMSIVTWVNRSPVLGGSVNTPVTALLLSPWILAILVLAFDRHGPLKYWLAPLLLMLFPPLLAICFDVYMVQEFIASGALPRLVPALLINGLFLPALVLFWTQTKPVDCPTCGDRSLIPLIHPWGRSKRTFKTRWCASCGSKFWRGSGKDWLPERRTTYYEDRPGVAAD